MTPMRFPALPSSAARPFPVRGQAPRATARTRAIRLLSLFLLRLRTTPFAALILAVCLALPLSLSPGRAQAQAAAPQQEIDKSLDAARKEMEALRKNLSEQTDDAELLRRRAAALEIQSKADAIADKLGPVLTSVQARLTELGPAVDTGKEARDIAAQRADLEKSRSTLDAQIKLARLLSVEGVQTAEMVSTMRRSQFQARLGERRPSILGAQFRDDLKDDLPRDLSRLASLRDELAAALSGTPGWVWTILVLLAGVIVALTVVAARVMRTFTASRVPAGRLRRSFHALVVVIAASLAPGLIGQLLYIGLDWQGQLPDATQTLVSGFAGILCLGGYVTGLGLALLSPSRPSWRLPDIPDRIAGKMRWFPHTLGPLIVVVWLLDRLPVSLNASLSTTIAVNCLVTFLLIAVVVAGLVKLERARRKALHNPETGQAPPRHLWLLITVSVVWLMIAIALIAVLTGYVAFGNFAAKQVIWTLIVLSSSYLLTVLVDDFFMSVLGASRRDGDAHERGQEPRIRDQAAVVLSGVARVLIGLVAFVMVLGQFAEGPVELLQRAEQLLNGLAIGQVQLRPAALVQGLIVLAVSLLAVRILKRWLLTRYLPTTTLDPGMQTSATTLFGYVGVVVAVGLALSAVGIGLERVAWVASALSVGIGFGLQAVVQNFVSGLILLAERPVKVGDWVSLGGVEGDIRRINVRATEIQMGDRSTVIVPNSEFITKTVRNVTHANPLGLVQIKLPMPLSTDAAKAREIILSAFIDHEDVLESPAPNVFLDGIDAGNLVFNATGYVGSPRQAYGTRSALLFEVLQRLAAANIGLGKPPTMLVSAPAAPLLPGISAVEQPRPAPAPGQGDA
ncbi:Potassium efflux system KefA [Bordetella sputigena]